MPLGSNGDRGSKGTVFLFTVMPALPKAPFGFRAAHLFSCQVDQQQMVVRTAGYQLVAFCRLIARPDVWRF